MPRIVFPLRLWTFLLFLGCDLTNNVVWSAETEAASSRPNVIVFMADDLGIGDLSCFGNKTMQTPNIDRLCEGGMKLTHHLAAAPLCTPSRAAFMTGRYAVRSGLEGEENTPPVIVYTSAKNGLPKEEVTWAKLLQNAGYRTGAFGKWHLGWDESSKGDQLHGPLGHGFDTFFGLPFTLVFGFERQVGPWTYKGFVDKDSPFHKHGMALLVSIITVIAVYSEDFGHMMLILLVVFFLVTWFFTEHFAMHTENWWQRSLFMEKFLNSMLMADRKVHEQPINLGKLPGQIEERSLAFLRESAADGAKDGRPFAMYLAFPQVHTPLVPSKRTKGKSQHGRYGDSLLEIDLTIGAILDELEKLGIAQNTLVYFTSDHGCHIDIANHGGSNGIFKGGKGIGVSEGGIRVPGIVKWPGKIKAGSHSDAVTSLMDFKPTINEILGGESSETVDGKSLLSLISGKTSETEHQVLRHYCGKSLHALRIVEKDGSILKSYFRKPILNDFGHCGFDKLCPCFGDGVENFPSTQLFDLVNDPREEKPLDEQSERYKEILPKIMAAKLEAERDDLPPSQYSSFWNVMPRPWIQPCAAFPLCQT